MRDETSQKVEMPVEAQNFEVNLRFAADELHLFGDKQRSFVSCYLNLRFNYDEVPLVFNMQRRSCTF